MSGPLKWPHKKSCLISIYYLAEEHQKVHLGHQTIVPIKLQPNFCYEKQILADQKINLGVRLKFFLKIK